MIRCIEPFDNVPTILLCSLLQYIEFTNLNDEFRFRQPHQIKVIIAEYNVEVVMI